jgi:hypothetical protein
MAEVDWDRLTTNALDDLHVSAGETSIGTPPNGSSCVGYHAIQAGAGFAGHIVNLTNYSPIASGKGGVISSCLKKFNGGDHSPLLFLANGKDVASSEGYIAGLGGETPSRIILKKGHLSTPLTENGEGVIAVSDEAFDPDEWVQIALYVTVNTHGEIALSLRRADPPDVVYPVTVAAIPGITDFVDDNGGILTGSQPYSGAFYIGHGVYFGGTQGRVALFDYTVVDKQDTP